MEQTSSGQETITAPNKRELRVCWTKLDRKPKKINFLITQEGNRLEEKATQGTIEAIQAEIGALEFKLDQISMFITSQVETEKVHFECKCQDCLSVTNASVR